MAASTAEPPARNTSAPAAEAKLWGGDHAARAEGGRAAGLHIQNKLLKA
jgi:hypothetical protein